jgi:hypothetical protein
MLPLFPALALHAGQPDGLIVPQRPSLVMPTDEELARFDPVLGMLPFPSPLLLGGGGSPTFQTVRANLVTDIGSTGWSGWTARQVVLASSLTDLTASQIRISFKAVSSGQLKIAKAYVGFKSGTNSFTATPTQLLFSGSASVLISANTVQATDPVAFAYDGLSDLVVTTYHDATAGYTAATTTARGTVYQKNSDDAATVSASGYSTGTTNDIIWLIEAA